MKASVYFDAKEPTVSAYQQPSNLFEAVPTMGEAIGAYTQETFQGEGSLSQDIQAINIRRSERRDVAIPEEDWKNSVNFRKGITYHPEMTEYSAKVLAESADARLNRQIVMDKATKLQTVAGFGVGFLSGIAEPKNLASGIAAALLTGGVGVAIPSVGRLIAVNSVRGAAIRGGAEGVVGAALTEPSNIESSRTVQGDYTMADSIMNLALGSILGAGIGGGAKHLELKGEAKRKGQLEAYRAEEGLAVKEFDTALAQITQGSEVDIHSVKQIDNIEKVQSARQELPRIEEKIAAYEMQTNSKIELSVLKSIGAPDAFGQQYYIMDGNREAGALLAKETENAIEIRRVNTAEDIQGKGFAVKAYEELAQKATNSGKELHSDIDVSAPAIRLYESLERKGYAVIKNPKATLQEDGGLSVPSIKDGPVFRVTESPPLNEVQKLQAKKAQAESSARIQTDNAPIKKLQDDLAKPDNSTAYNPKSSSDIDKYLDEFQMEDDIALERSLEFMEEDIQNMNEEGLLSGEQLVMLDRLKEIDSDVELYDNVLRSAYLCLTRG